MPLKLFVLFVFHLGFYSTVYACSAGDHLCELKGSTKVILGDFDTSNEPAVDRGGRFGVLAEVLKQQGLELSITWAPRKRMTSLLEEDSVDLLVLTDDDAVMNSGNYIRSNYVATFMTIGMYYQNQSDWTPTWPPDSRLQSAQGVTVNLFRLIDSHNLKLNRVSEYDDGVKMVNLGRADYVLDSIWALENARDDHNQLLMKTVDQGFAARELYKYVFYFWFKDNPRGNALKTIIDEAHRDLYLDRDRFIRVWQGALDPKDRRANRYQWLLENFTATQ